MKRLALLFSVLYSFSALAQSGYEIKVTMRPFKNQYIFLGHYFGKTYPIIDSVKLNDKSEGTFKGSTKLPGGIYLIGYPDRSGFFEVLVDKQQHFSIVADTATISQGVQFINSPDNILFSSYQRYMSEKGKEINDDQQKLKTATNASDSAQWTAELGRLDKTVHAYREDLIKKNPGTILSALLMAMREPDIPEAMRNPKNKKDSLEQFYYYKNHFWDGTNFSDGRLAYTTFFEDKLDKFYNQLVAPYPDSVNKEIDLMLAYATPDEEMTRFLLLKFVNRYLNQKYMWEDAIFVHLFEKYFSQKTYSWLNEKGKKTITDRAYNLMANIMGTPASDIILPDSSGQAQQLYGINADFIIVCFWDPTCGHCKETLPKIDSFYQAKWKKEGVKIYAIAKETDGTKNDWTSFITANHLWEWTHVYYSKVDDKTRIDAGIPGYSQLYDVLTFPTLYLLDKNKRIIAKKLTYQQIDDVLEVKIKAQ